MNTEYTALGDLYAVLGPRNGRTDNGCILVHERVLHEAIAALEAAEAENAKLRAQLAETEQRVARECARIASAVGEGEENHSIKAGAHLASHAIRAKYLTDKEAAL